MSAELALLWALFVEGLLIMWQLIRIRSGVLKKLAASETTEENKQAA